MQIKNLVKTIIYMNFFFRKKYILKLKMFESDFKSMNEKIYVLILCNATIPEK